jgi:hypothetical protein
VDPERFQFLWETLSGPEGRLFAAGIAIVGPLGLLFFYWSSKRRVRPLFVWTVLTIATFAGSQLFPENRSQAGQLAIFSPIVSALATLLWFRVAPSGRASLPRTPRSDA